MADNFVTNPVTTTGGSTFASDDVGGVQYPRMKMTLGADGVSDGDVSSTNPLPISGTVALSSVQSLGPSTAVVGHVAVDSLPIVTVSSGAILGVSTAVVGHVIVDSGAAPSTTVDANLTSAGSSKVVGTVNLSSGTQVIGSVAPSSQWTVASSTLVDANLTSAGSSKVIGTVGVSSGAVLGPSTAVIGLVGQGSAGSSNDPWNVELMGGSSGVTIGSVALVAGSSANTVGAVVQGAGSSANAWYTQSIAFSSGNAARTTINTSVDVQIIAANAGRKALIIASLSTAQTVAVGLTTAAMTTALANASVFLSPTSYLLFGLSGGLPIYQGPIRAINITSTAVGGGVAVTEFT